VRLEKNAGRKQSTVEPLIGTFERGIPVERDDTFDDACMDESSKALMGNRRLCAAFLV
jgi:hypothetical protein